MSQSTAITDLSDGHSNEAPMLSRFSPLHAGSLIAVMLAMAGDAIAEPVQRTALNATSGEDTVIRIGVRFDSECNIIGVPDFVLEQPPSHGHVCIREGDVTPTNAMHGKHQYCLNRRVKGRQLVYRSQTGFSGFDSLVYRMILLEGTRLTQTTIKVQGPALTSGEFPTSSFTPQNPGPVPECTDHPGIS
jgi:hypothetical protein